MEISQAVYHIIYNEIWKLFKRSVGELQTQNHLDDIKATSQIIFDKLEGARLIDQKKVDGVIAQELTKLVDKAKLLNKKLGSKDGKK